MYQFTRVTTDIEANTAHARLLADVFEKPQLFTPAYIQWQYAANPAGAIVGYNAMAGDVIAAHYVTQPFYALIDRVKTKGLLSLNTATHANHRGKGLFTQLADKTYEAAAAEGFGFVIGVANQNSVHGFVNKLGFQLVGCLDAKVGLGNVPQRNDVTGLQYERVWDDAMLQWRLQNPVAKYMAATGKQQVFYAKTHLPFIKAQLLTANTNSYNNLQGPGLNPFTLYIGKDKGISFKNSFFADIPNRFKSAPLHLIFKDLTGQNRQLNFENIRFSLLDFDAY